MAQFSSNFQADTLGIPPSGWTKRWRATLVSPGSTFDVTTTDEGQFTSFGDRHVYANNLINNSQSCISFNAVGDVSDVDVTMRLRGQSSVSDWAPGPVIRGSGIASTSETGYTVHIDASNDEIVLDKFVGGGARQVVASAVFNDVSPLTAWFYVRIQAVGTALKVRHWIEGADEPSTWDIEVTDSSIAGPGWIGIWSYNGDGQFDWLGAGTAGSAPPSPPSAEGAARVTQTTLEVLRTGNPKSRVSQATLEVLRTGDPNARVSQAMLEVLRSPVGSAARVSQATLEVMRSPAMPEARVTQAVLEVMRSRPGPSGQANIQFTVS